MQTDLRYFFHVNLIFTAIDLDDEMPVSCLFDEICRQVLDAVAGLKEMDVYGPAAIREGFANLRPGVDYDGLRKAALCRAKADWLVGINATRLFSVLYHRTLNIGRVMSPTLALIVQREAEIDTSS